MPKTGDNKNIRGKGNQENMMMIMKMKIEMIFQLQRRQGWFGHPNFMKDSWKPSIKLVSKRLFQGKSVR
ncbi:hypothetical protein AQUCO_01300430v1 [Aquilegia coerulea]|uniref:Uncharacterized protein n=1 Tax=Aquilegia coerulea TaxID=218851 RepID=A0A2G5E1P3_AQUCA|nr:hypothetical protein AQUCO_01300430v1 [Aquilegia coerulea]